MAAQSLALHRTRRIVVVVIEPRLADSYHAIIICEIGNARNRLLAVTPDRMRMDTGSGPDVRILVCDLQTDFGVIRMRADRDHACDAVRPGSFHDVTNLAVEFLVG